MLDTSTFAAVGEELRRALQAGESRSSTRGATRSPGSKSGNGDFCGYVFSPPEGKRCCTQTVARVKDGPLATTQNARAPAASPGTELDVTIAVPAFTGLRHLLLLILWEGHVLGRVVFGALRPR